MAREEGCSVVFIVLLAVILRKDKPGRGYPS
jgi:hypothetical protein